MEIIEETAEKLIEETTTQEQTTQELKEDTEQETEITTEQETAEEVTEETKITFINEEANMGMLAYIKDGNIYLKDLSNGQVKKLTTDGKNHNPSFSPSGQWIACYKNDKINLIQISNGETRVIKTNEVVEFFWSPVSDTIAYITWPGSLFVASSPEWMEESFKNFDMPCVLGEIAENEVDEDDSERAKWLVKEANSNLYMVLALDDFLDEDEEYTKERGLNLKLFDIFEIIGKAQYNYKMFNGKRKG